MKVGPAAGAGASPIVPPFHAYSGQRGIERASIDLKAPAGRDAFLRLAAQCRRRPGELPARGDGPARPRVRGARGRQPRHRLLLDQRLRPGRPARARAGHDLNYLAVGGYLHMSGRDGAGRPVLPGATVADIAAGGMAAAIAILAALVRRHHGEGPAGRRRGRRRAWMPVALHRRVPRHRRRAGAGAHILTGRYACYDVYGTADGGWLAVAAIEPAFWANLCGALGLERWREHQTDDAAQDEIGPTCGASSPSAAATSGWRCWPTPTRASPRCCRSPRSSPTRSSPPGARWSGPPGRTGLVPQLAPLLAGTVRCDTYELPDPAVTATAACWARPACRPGEIDALAAEGVIA